MISTARYPGLALLAFLLWNCATTLKPQQGFYPSGKMRYSIDRDKEGRKVGRESWWHENGTLKYEATYVEGFRQGKYAAFYTDGKPWYQGFEIMGRPESTLTYWHPNGNKRSEAFFRQGIQLSRLDFDDQGKPLNLAPKAPLIDDVAAARRKDSLQAIAARNQALGGWSKKVRAAVESYWVVPKELAAKGPLRAVAKVRVSRHGDIENVSWITKSPVSSFNHLAAATFKKVKRLPPFPPQIYDLSLEIEYAFVSGGREVAKSRLRSGQLREDVQPEGVSGDSSEAGSPIPDP